MLPGGMVYALPIYNTINRQRMKAVRIHSFGGPEVLKFEEAPTPELNPDEALIKADEVIDYKNEKKESSATPQ